MRFLAYWTVFAIFAFMPHSAAIADDHPSKGEMADFKIYSDIKWVQGPPSLPKGAMMAVLEGDPAKEGQFVFRVKLPDGYRVPPHTHPKIERVTVISGTFNIGMGDTFDEKATKAMPAGAYGYWPAGMKHFVWSKGETVLQFHGIGPWSIEYVNPNDDPRRNKKAGQTRELQSGPQPRQSLPGPVSGVVAHSGEPTFVGKRMDFVEYAGGNPLVLIFAREMTEPLAAFVKTLDTAMAERKAGNLKALLVILANDDATEKSLLGFGKQQEIRHLHLASMEPNGPNHYQLSAQADVTVLLAKNRKVYANHAFKQGTFDRSAAETLVASVLLAATR
jgi:quercetin dioxygenase-like cupin family protein